MDASVKRNIQIVMVIALVAAGLRTAWIFYQRHESDKATHTESAPARKLHSDDYVYLRPSHVYDLASAKKFLVGKTVWVKAGNAVAYFPYANFAVGEKEEGVLPPLAALTTTNVITHGTQMYAVFMFNHDPSALFSTAYCGTRLKQYACAVPIGSVRNGDYNIIIDDIFYYEDPHKLYPDWSKDQWDAIARHEITQGMSEMMAQAAMGVPHAPESGGSGGDQYGNRTLVFTDPAHPDKPVTVRFVDNAAVNISK